RPPLPPLHPPRPPLLMYAYVSFLQSTAQCLQLPHSEQGRSRGASPIDARHAVRRASSNRGMFLIFIFCFGRLNWLLTSRRKKISREVIKAVEMKANIRSVMAEPRLRFRSNGSSMHI
ncbi:hypothetical protein PENTCL1PPCAC_10194, partial [Pristionchus entomophagus]